MSKYFNRTRGPLSISFDNKKSVLIRPNSWVEIPDEWGLSNMLLRYINKGFLYRCKIDDSISLPTKGALILPKIGQKDTEVLNNMSEVIKDEIETELVIEDQKDPEILEIVGDDAAIEVKKKKTSRRRKN